MQKEDIALQKWITDSRYHILWAMKSVLRQILNNVKEARWFAVIADETRDISNSEQLCISIRWVCSDYTIYKDVIGLMQAPKTDAETLKMAILKMFSFAVQYH